ncbi:DUF2273 domain-containing protein [Lactobacillus sp. ESL0785]|uniref:DUF2273 domain-containing protein n=1 Tax=Lactobacillus sp. ESL0785 TaxID=2983232 RepID=UPI0023F9C3BE|nr:DUF2273 domain-containing protein [Lactobacillus sp. ESL0785]WEV70850.1 DUF2273 domain-containing protein [Lactobacillus sp. ESL0785]
MNKFLQKHFSELSGALSGLLLAFCFLGLGFFKTVFVIVMLICGLIIGHYWPVVKRLMNK